MKQTVKLILLTLTACNAQSFFFPALSGPAAEETYGAVLGDTSLILYGNSPGIGEVYVASLDATGSSYGRDRPQYSRPVPYSDPPYRPVPIRPYNQLYSPVTAPPRNYRPTIRPVPYSPLSAAPSQVYRPPVVQQSPPVYSTNLVNPAPVLPATSLVNPPPILSALPIRPVYNQSLPIPLNRVVPPSANAASVASSYSDGSRTGAQSLSYTG